MKGWGRSKPKTVGERETLYSKCGGRCFMLPREKKYPVCKKGGTTCKYDCRGLLAAYSRGKSNHSKGLGRKHLTAANKALRIAARIDCPWTR